jgi:hypothetical protein
MAHLYKKSDQRSFSPQPANTKLGSVEDEWETSQDADALARHSEMAGDKKRHSKAVKHLHKRALSKKADAQKAHALHQTVKAGLKKAFPEK